MIQYNIEGLLEHNRTPEHTDDIPEVPSRITTSEGQIVDTTQSIWTVTARRESSQQLPLEVTRLGPKDLVLTDRASAIARLFISHLLRWRKPSTAFNYLNGACPSK